MVHHRMTYLLRSVPAGANKDCLSPWMAAPLRAPHQEPQPLGPAARSTANRQVFSDKGIVVVFHLVPVIGDVLETGIDGVFPNALDNCF